MKYVLLLLTMLAVRSGQAGTAPSEPSLGVQYCPAAAYRSEPATFVVQTTPDDLVTAKLDGEGVGEARANAAGAAELNILLPGAARLTLDGHGWDTSFELVTPSCERLLETRDGRLFTTNGVAAILLVEHLAPPKHDRRWETLGFVAGLVTDTRPTYGSGLLAGSPPATPLPDKPEDWCVVPLPRASYEIDGLVLSVAELQPADFLLVALSGRDLELGIDWLEWQLKLEWYLQAAAGVGYSDIFVVEPGLHGAAAARHPQADQMLRLACLANGAAPICFHERLGPEMDNGLRWWKAVMARIAEVARCE